MSEEQAAAMILAGIAALVIAQVGYIKSLFPDKWTARKHYRIAGILFATNGIFFVATVIPWNHASGLLLSAALGTFAIMAIWVVYKLLTAQGTPSGRL